MANDTTANIILRLKDEFSKGLVKAGKDFDSFAHSVDRMGTSMARTGAKMVAVGTTMNAPFYAAAAVMTKYSMAAHQQMDRLANEFLSLSKIMADAALPTIREFNNNFTKLINLLKTIDPVLIQNVAHWSMVTGAILIAIGTFDIFFGKIISLLAKLALFIGSTGALAIAITGVVVVILSQLGLLNTAWDMLRRGADIACAGIQSAFAGLKATLLASIHGILWAFEELNNFFHFWKNGMKLSPTVDHSLSKAIGEEVQKSVGELQRLNTELQRVASGETAGQFTGLVNKATAAFNKISTAWKSTSTKIKTVSEDMGTFAKQEADMIGSKFGDMFDRVIFEGQKFSTSFKQMMRDIGRQVIRDVISKVISAAINMAFGTMGGGSAGGFSLGSMHSGGMITKYHNGGLIYAHNGLAPDEVPIVAQTGEGVLSRKGMAALGGSDNLRALNNGQGMDRAITYSPVVVIQAWDTADVYRNRKALSAALSEEIKNNGSLRDTIKRYK